MFLSRAAGHSIWRTCTLRPRKGSRYYSRKVSINIYIHTADTYWYLLVRYIKDTHNNADSGCYWHFKMYLLFLYVISDKDTVYMITGGVPLYLDSDYSDLSIWFEQNTRMELTFQTMRALL